jgi:hypothetical protein
MRIFRRAMNALRKGAKLRLEALESRCYLSGDTPDPPTEVVDPGDVSTSAWVQRLYLDTLGRPSSTSEKQFWLGLLDSGVSKESIAISLLNSRERRAGVIEDYYQKVLDRSVDPAGLEFWLGVWDRTGGPDVVRASLIGSGEFFQKAGGTTEGATQKLYNDVLRRSASSSEVAYWIPVLEAVPLANVALGFITSDEYRRTLVEGWYSEYLHRAMDPGADQFWVGRMKAGVSQSQIQASLLGGVEYATQPYFDVRDWGATANDATDDSAAIQAALNNAYKAGNSFVYLPAGTFLVDFVKMFGANQKFAGPGTLKLKNGSVGQAVMNVAGNRNTVALMTIDGNINGNHLGEAEGLIVYGHYNHIYRVNIIGTASADSGSPNAVGSNVVIAGNNNRIEETFSAYAGYSNYKQVGDGNRYINIVSRDARVKGFTGKGDGASFTVDGGHFSITSAPQSTGATSFQIDPNPTRWLGNVALRNITVIGPVEMNNTSSAAKIALVENLLIENSRFFSTTDTMTSLRFAEGMGDVVMRNVFMNRSLIVQQDAGANVVVDSIYMENVTIGDGSFRPDYAMQYVKTKSLTMVGVRLTNFAVAGIQWETPNAYYDKIVAVNTVFEGYAAGRSTFDIKATGIGQLNANKMQWTNVRRANLAGNGAAFTG